MKKSYDTVPQSSLPLVALSLMGENSGQEADVNFQECWFSLSSNEDKNVPMPVGSQLRSEEPFFPLPSSAPKTPYPETPYDFINTVQPLRLHPE